MGAVGLLIVVYMILVALCARYGLWLSVSNGVVDQGNDEKLEELVQKIGADERWCFHCAERYLNDVKVLSNNQRDCKMRAKLLKHSQLWFKLLSILNSIVAFVVFGGPALISLVSLSSSVLVFASTCVENRSGSFFVELCVAITTAITFLKSLYVLLVAFAASERRKAN